MTKLNEALALEAARRLEPITWSDHVVAIMTQCGDELTDVGDPNFWFEVQELLYAVAGTSFAAEAEAEQRAWAERLAVASLKAAGASRHQIFRFRKKIAGGADLDVEVAALKDRLEFDRPENPFREAGTPKPFARIAIARVAREHASAPEPIDLGGVYEMPWLTAA